jgi:hypothetical protein
VLNIVCCAASSFLAASPQRVDAVEKVFFGGRTNFYSSAGAAFKK